MKKVVILAAIAFAIFFYIGVYNSLVTWDESVKQSYSQVQNVMQRQADLIPNLVETVKAAAAHENKTLVQVSEARARLTAVAKMDPEKLAADPALQKQLIDAQAATQQALLSINALREAYPTLQANANFRDLMAELSGSQNRITVERRKNQLAVQAYNVATRSALTGTIAKIHGFAPRPYFEAMEQGQVTPTVKF